MKKILLAAILSLSSVFVFAQTKWALDTQHSGVKFTVTHMVISEVEGSFKTFSGSILSPSAKDFNGASVEFLVDVNSVATEDEKRDGHLKSPDFFDVAKYPAMKFKSISFKKTGEHTYDLVGDLTIKDVTKRVKFAVTNGGIIKDPYGFIRTGFQAKAKINRLEYGLKWNNLTEAGGAVVSQDVDVKLNLEFIQPK